MKTTKKAVKKPLISIGREGLERVSMKGAYCLLIKCGRSQSIQIGKLGVIDFTRGYYLYVGSALNGLGRRVSRHLRNEKNKFWHIDYLLTNRYVNIEQVYCIECDKKIECQIAEKVGTMAESVEGFGSSDCRCRGHLFFMGNRKAGWRNFLFI
jgi:Uri superfamily endonuclease